MSSGFLLSLLNSTMVANACFSLSSPFFNFSCKESYLYDIESLTCVDKTICAFVIISNVLG